MTIYLNLENDNVSVYIRAPSSDFLPIEEMFTDS